MEELDEVRLNTHIQHIEDLMLFGKEGIEELNDKIEGFQKQLDGDAGYNISQKIDGAPAALLGHGLKGYPEVCVGIKSFLNDASNALSSDEEIESKYGDRPGMASMLKYCLQLAKSIPMGEAWQGDCLFIKSTLKEREINGTNYITFQPNKIIYAFPEGSDSYNKIANSDFGICLHTRYTQTQDGWSQSFRLEEIDVPSNIYVLSPSLSYSKDKTDYSLDKVNELYDKLKKIELHLLENDNYENLVNNKEFMKFWNTFENANLSDKKQVNLDVKTVYSDLVSYVKDKMKKEFDTKMSKLKTDKGREKAQVSYSNELEELSTFIKDHKNTIILLVEAINTAANIKMLLLPGLTKNKPDYKSFLRKKSTGEYIDSDGEGISISDAKGNIVKLVDRSTFSSANRDPDIESGFDHNESLEESNEDSNIIIRVNIEDSTNEGVITGNPDDYTTDMLDEWFDFTDDVEDIIEHSGDIISTVESNSLSSLSKYIDFYMYNDDGSRKKCLVDLRLSDHRQTVSAKKKRSLEANKIDPNHVFITITINDKTFKSYDDALAYLRSVLTRTKDTVESYEEDNRKLYLDETDDWVKNTVNTVANTDKDPAVRATKEYHKMKLKKLKPGQMIVSSLQEKIAKKGSKYQVQSEKGRNMGTYDTKAEAEKRLQQVHYFKYKNEDLDEDLDKRLIKLLGDNADSFSDAVNKLVKANKVYDYTTHGLYRPDEYGPNEKDTSGNLIQKKLDNVHNFWLKFGLDTSKRGVGSLINTVLLDAQRSYEDTQEYRDNLDDDSFDKLPEDEKFKLGLFYNWDAMRKNSWGEYDDNDPMLNMSFRQYLKYLLDNEEYSGREKQLVKDAISELDKGGNFIYGESLEEDVSSFGDIDD